MARYSVEDLLYTMSRLRDPDGGCPWDLKQDFSTIVPSTIEECFELVDAIEQQNYPHVREELGDVLFQVIFYSQLGKEKQLFDFAAVVSELVEKLLRRHPHVFIDGELYGAARAQKSAVDEQQVKRDWEEIKASERQQKTLPGVLDDIPAALPAMIRANKMQKRASREGFDWSNSSEVLDALQGEITELKEAIDSGRQMRIEDEMGDVLFTCVNLSRHLKVEPESALRGSNRKFERRFRYIEEQLAISNKTLGQSTLDELDLLWDKAKLQE